MPGKLQNSGIAVRPIPKGKYVIDCAIPVSAEIFDLAGFVS